MKFLQICCALSILVTPSHCLAHKLECPAFTPSAWGVHPRGRLSSGAVLSNLKGAKTGPVLDGGFTPDDEVTRGDSVRQYWNMNTFDDLDETIQCLYQGTQRYLLLPSAGLKRCYFFFPRDERQPPPWPRFYCD